MVIVGELINASRESIKAAIIARDAEAIQKVATEQADAGADYIDVNAGIFMGKESEHLSWLIEVVQQATEKPCAIDSPDPMAIEGALSVHNGTPMINSISLEKERYEKLSPIIAGTDLKVVALCMSDDGMPQTAEDRVRIADQLINALLKDGISLDSIYIDPLVQPLSVNNTFGAEFLSSIETIMNTFRGVHTICGLSNISYGLPNRSVINQIFMSMAIGKGLDGAIVNPLDRRMMANIVTAEALAGRDDYCMHFLSAFRAGMLDV